jgi:hypothetical protein
VGFVSVPLSTVNATLALITTNFDITMFVEKSNATSDAVPGRTRAETYIAASFPPLGDGASTTLQSQEVCLCVGVCGVCVGALWYRMCVHRPAHNAVALCSACGRLGGGGRRAGDGDKGVGTRVPTTSVPAL